MSNKILTYALYSLNKKCFLCIKQLPMNKHLLIFDIETIPCVETGRRLLGFDSSVSDETVQQKMIEYHLHITNGQNAFLRQPFHKVVCISFMLCEVDHTQNGESYTIKELKTGGRNGESEKEILEKFCSFLQKYKPRLISFNGKTFDIPVIQYRSMMHKIPCPWLYSREMSYKFNHEPHCDLIDAFSNFGASARVKMSEVAALLNIPCKQTGSGDGVLSMHEAGKIQEICNYCEEDVVVTYMLYLNYQMHRGVLELDVFERTIAKANELLGQH